MTRALKFALLALGLFAPCAVAHAQPDTSDTRLLTQPAISARDSRRMKRLFDLIDTHSHGGQSRYKGPSLQIPHVSPFLDNDISRRELLTLASE